MTRYKGDWNTHVFHDNIFSNITHWPDIKGIETIVSVLIILNPLITHWPDIKGIETIVLLWYSLLFYYTLTRYKGDWNELVYGISWTHDYYTLTRYKGDWNQVMNYISRVSIYYTLTRYKGDWNTVQVWFLSSTLITHWPDIKGIETSLFMFGLDKLIHYTLTRYKGDWNFTAEIWFPVSLLLHIDPI